MKEWSFMACSKANFTFTSTFSVVTDVAVAIKAYK
jgi:hypothetical protein